MRTAERKRRVEENRGWTEPSWSRRPARRACSTSGSGWPREIHDTLAQGLTGHRHPAARRREQAARRPATGSGTSDNAAELARDEPGRGAPVGPGVRPEPLEDCPAADALADVAERWSAHDRRPGRGDHHRRPPRAAPGGRGRAAADGQEALANVGQARGASRAGLTLSYMEDVVTLDVRDDGIGFDGRRPGTGADGRLRASGSSADAPAGWNRAGRARSAIESEPGGGTRDLRPPGRPATGRRARTIGRGDGAETAPSGCSSSTTTRSSATGCAACSAAIRSSRWSARRPTATRRSPWSARSPRTSCSWTCGCPASTGSTAIRAARPSGATAPGPGPHHLRHGPRRRCPAIEAGATGYLLKDSPRDELFRAVRAAARGESVLCAVGGDPADRVGPARRRRSR